MTTPDQRRWSRPSRMLVLLSIATILSAAFIFTALLIRKHNRIQLIKAALFDFGESVSLTEHSPTNDQLQTALKALRAQLPQGSVFLISPKFTTHPDRKQVEAYINDSRSTGFFLLYYTPDYSCRVKFYDSRIFSNTKAEVDDFRESP